MNILKKTFDNRHFDSKMDILIAILSQFKNSSQILSSKIISDKTSSIKQLESIYNHNFKNFSENPALAAVIFSEEIFQNDKRLSDMVNSIMQVNQNMIIKIIKNGQKNQEIRNDILIGIFFFKIKILPQSSRINKNIQTGVLYGKG